MGSRMLITSEYVTRCFIVMILPFARAWHFGVLIVNNDMFALPFPPFILPSGLGVSRVSIWAYKETAHRPQL